VRLVAYLRVSTNGQAERGFGLNVQLDQITAWANAYGHEVVRVCRDQVSGTTDAVDRDGLSCVLDAVPDDAEGVVMARLDRLARSVTVQEAILAKIWWQNGGRVFALDQGGEVLQDDPDDPMRTAMREMAGVFAGLDRRMIVKRLRDGRMRKAAAGGHGVGKYPFGWSKDGPVPREQRVLDVMRELRAAGEPWHKVAAQLNDRGNEFRPRTAVRWNTSLVNHAGRKAGIT
jgi:DNA invertase Pin-like site-specific DNA recombinase